MKNKYADNSDEENEFDVDEPEEIQNNASDDDWTPDKDDASGGRRTSTRLRNIPKSRAPIIDASSSDENSDDSEGGKRKNKNRGRGRPSFFKKQKVSSTTTSPIKISTENGGKSANSDSEPTSTTTNTTSTTNNTNNSGSPAVLKVSKEFTSGAFVVLKTDAANLETDPPLWKIDGKALLQKYIPFEMEGKTFYKNTSVYSGWTINNKDNYYPVSVIFKQQTRKEHVVEFHRDQIKLEDQPAETETNVSSEEKE